MALTYHSVRLFRLSCGCLRAFSLMPAGAAHTVLCITCRAAAVTVRVYPQRSCAVQAWAVVAGRRTRVSCTRPAGACTAGEHFDGGLMTGFTTRVTPLAQGREGKTGRA
jgi:hypothetical protein